MWTIKKQFEFSASHQLDHLPKTHPCARLHGHNYIVEVELAAGFLDIHTSFVVDYNELSALREHINSYFDHRHLNNVLPNLPLNQTKSSIFTKTTAENLALYFYLWCKGRWPQTVAVSVSETPKTWARYSEE